MSPPWFRLTLVTLLSLHAGLWAQTTLRILPPEPTYDGWIATALSEDQECLPAEVETGAQLRIGSAPGESCEIYRSFAAFDIGRLTEFQIASARLFLYRTGVQGVPTAGDNRLALDLIQAGPSLDIEDWEAAAITTVPLAITGTGEAAEMETDVTSLLTYTLESGRDHLTFRFRLIDESAAGGYILVESGRSLTAGLSPRLEVIVNPPVLAPASLRDSLTEPAGAAVSGLDEGTFIGVAQANPDNPRNLIRTEWFSPDGRRLRDERQALVARDGQRAFVVGDPRGASTLLARGNVGGVQGFFMVGDHDLRRLDGIGGELPIARVLYLPYVARENGTDSHVFLFNPASTPQPGVRLSLFENDGTLRAERLVDLPGKGTLSAPLDRLFGEGLETSAGYLGISATEGVQAFAFIVGERALASLASQEPLPADRLLAPHFFIGAAEGSRVFLLNLEEEEVEAHVTAFDDAGAPVDTTSVSLAAGALLAADLSDLLDLRPLSASSPLTGYLEVRFGQDGGDARRVLGVIDFGADTGDYRTILPLMTAGRRETLILQVAQSADLRIFTGLAVLNGGDESAQVSVRAYRPSGEIAGAAVFSLGAGERRVDLLDTPDYFGSGFSQVGGHLRISADQPLVVFAIFGDLDLRYLSAIESQRPTAGFPHLEIRRQTCDGNPSPTVLRLTPDPRQSGPLRFGAGDTVVLELALWDNSVWAGPLGLSRGIGNISWDTGPLNELGLTPTTILDPDVSPHAARSRLTFTVPSGVRRVLSLHATGIDVEGCATGIRIDLRLGD